MMFSLRQPTIRTSYRVIKSQVPVVTELNGVKRHNSSYEHYLKYGHGGRNSFNGLVTTVFGASGFLGRYVVNRLARTGTQIIIPYRGIDEDVRHLRLMGDLGQIVFAEYDLRDEESIAKTLTHSNVAINLVGRDFPTRNFDLDDVLVKGAETISRLAAENNVKRLIHLSALSAKSDSPSAFFHKKAVAERAVLENFRNATIIKPAQIYGEEDRYFNRYAALKLFKVVPIVGGGMQTTKRPVFVADVAQAIVNAAKDETTSGKSYELYGPDEFYLRDIVEYLYRLMRAPFRPIPVPLPAYKLAGYFGEFSPFNPKLTREMAIRESLSEDVTGDGYTFEDLGIQPSSINHQALDVVRHYRTYYYFDEILDEETDICRPMSEH